MISGKVYRVNYWNRRMNLKQNFQIQDILKKAGYYDISRIANEIQSYSEKTGTSIDDILTRIKTGEPWEYISGVTEFRGSSIFVNENTLIPRIETEQIVDIALELINGNKHPYSKIIDVGTGSGSIIISLVKEMEGEREGEEREGGGEEDNNNKEEGRGELRRNMSYLATEIDRDALSVAKKNAVYNKVEHLIQFKQRNLVNQSDITDNSLVIANLPYIPTDMYMNLDSSVKDFEPRTALDGGKDGLDYYKNLIDIIKNSGKINMDLLIEIEPSTLEILKKHTNQEVTVFQDFRDKNRFVLLHFS